MPPFSALRPWSGLLLGLLLTACAVPTPPADPADEGAEAPAPVLALPPALRRALDELTVLPEAGGEGWRPFTLPGKRSIPFEVQRLQGQTALAVHASNSVSILRHPFTVPQPATQRLRFQWQVEALPDNADLSDAQREDAPVRVVLTFDGDRERLPPRFHRLSDLSQLLTGEPLPYATLAYVWSEDDPVGAVVPNPRTDRIRKLVVESGTAGLGRWRVYERDVRADFRHAFGEDPGPLTGVSLMTDTDNTRSNLRAWYGALSLQPVER